MWAIKSHGGKWNQVAIYTVVKFFHIASKKYKLTHINAFFFPNDTS